MVASPAAGLAGARRKADRGNSSLPVGTTNGVIMEDLSAIPKDDWCVVSYESFLGDPAGEIKRLCEFMDIQFAPRLREVTSRPLRLSRHTLEPPDPDKWRNNEAELSRVLLDIEAVAERIRAFSEA
jgi:hypothetical protein